jgi:hypothetical protein
MGGQACVFYGAAEFSRDLDLLILADARNIESLRQALAELRADPIAVPPFDTRYLDKGHALHFRCRHEEAAGLRIDIMSHYRCGPPFEELWQRRTTIEVDAEKIDLLSLPDLVAAKKTQRDKDWPMIGRLVERSYFESVRATSEDQIEFLFSELRSPDLLVELAARFATTAQRLAQERNAIAAAISADRDAVAKLLAEEENEERRKDREYWQPLKAELEQLRRSARGTPEAQR